MKIYSKINKFLVSSKYSKPFNCFLVLLIAVSYIYRAHPYIFRPQFYAEDGTVWLAGAFDDQLKSILHPYNGFSQLFERLFSLFAVHFVPLQYEPVFYVVSAFLIFMLLCYYLFTKRNNVLSSNYQRLFVALSLCLLANAEELYFNFSNSVFYLGLVGLFIIVINKSRYRSVNLLEKILFFILCFTSIFAWLYLVILLIEQFYYHRKKYYYLICAVLGSATQFFVYAHSSIQRQSIPLHEVFSGTTLVELYNQIIVPSLRFGRLDINPLTTNTSSLIFVYIAFFLVMIASIAVFYKSNYRTKYVLLFCLLMTLFSLKSPADAASVAFMATTGSGNRYFIFGILGLFVVWAKISRELIRRDFLAIFLLVFFTFAVVSSIRLGSFYVQQNLVNMTQQYSSGVTDYMHHRNRIGIIPTNPPGWIIELTPKRSPMEL